MCCRYLKHREPFMLLTYLVVYCHLAFVAAPVIMSAHTGASDRFHSVLWLARLIGTEALLTSPIGLQVHTCLYGCVKGLWTI